MLAAGLPPVVANASNAVAISPGHSFAAVADREKLPAADRRVAPAGRRHARRHRGRAAAARAARGRVPAAGAAADRPRDRAVLVPAPRIQAWAARRREGAAPNALAGTAALTAVSVYGGFFGAGLGVMLSAAAGDRGPRRHPAREGDEEPQATAVSLGGDRDLHRARHRALAGHARDARGRAARRLGRRSAGGVLPAQAVRRVVIAAGLLMSVLRGADLVLEGAASVDRARAFIA